MKNDAGEMSMSEDSKQKAWLEHYQRLLNVEFDWDPDHLSVDFFSLTVQLACVIIISVNI